jgi:uncharacterized protein
MIINEILGSVESLLARREVVDVRIGLGYTGVLLDDGSMGLAYTFRDEVDDCCQAIDSAGELGGSALEIGQLALSTSIIEVSLGLAAINAVLNRDVQGVQGDLFSFLDIREGDKVGIIGDFRLMIDDLPPNTEIMVFERKRTDPGTYPDWAAEQMLPDADVVVITGTTVINKTIDHLLELSRDARTVAVVGPSTPLSGVFRDHGVRLLGGMVVEDPRMAMRIIGQGGGTRKLGRVCKKITIDLSVEP